MQEIRGYGAAQETRADALGDESIAHITRQSLYPQSLYPQSLFPQSQFSAIGAASSGISPTVSQLLNAANTEYLLGGTPQGMSAFTVGGQQLSYLNEADGVSAKVWVTSQNQVVIAYQGTTGGLNLLTNPLIALTQIVQDVGIYSKQVTPGEKDSLAFAKSVIATAAARGITSANVFVTGHSLGGIEAEYVAQQTGLGGIAFESTGIPAAANAAAGKNFVNVVTYGDPVANYASDISAMQPFAPSSGLAHYGQVVLVGNPADEVTLHNDVQGWGNWWNPIQQAGILTNLIGLMGNFHLPGVQAHDLGVTLNPYSSIVDGLGVQSGPVFAAGGDTVNQLISQAGGSGHLIAHGAGPAAVLGHFA